jgi:hypothetical protein
MNKSLLLMLLIAVPLLLVTAANFGSAQTATQVGGLINSDTTWTQANSPYNLTSPVIISYGATLTVKPGVTVNLNGFNLQINGILYAQGNSSNNIVFDSSGGNIVFTGSSTSWTEKPVGYGCIIENAVINNASVSVISTAPMLDNNTISNQGSENGAIYTENGAPIISNNNINGDILCLDAASPTITGNFIHGGVTGEGFDLASPVIVNNIIEGGTGQMESGTGIFADGANYYIANNTIFGCYTGISVDSGTPIIEDNLIINNTNGISVSGPTGGVTTIIHNTICNSSVGLGAYGSAGIVTVTYNNLVSNTKYTLGGNLTYNWWGTTNQTAIAQILPNGTAFVPFLNAPDPQDPAIPNNLPSTPPSPSPSPSSSPSSSPATSTGSTQTQALTSANSTPAPTEQPTAPPSTPSTSIPELSALTVLTFLTASLVIAVALTVRKRNH